ncbi:MAG: c-type cytochrome [Pseudomonadota bacterium]
MRPHIFVLSILALTCVNACDLSPRSSYGFRLPDGDPEHGKQVFMEMQCASCHAVADDKSLREGVEPEMTVVIGGMATRVDTYGELVTSVINPSHRIARNYRSDEFSEDGDSKMRSYNDVLTVTEMIDLVAYLQGQYTEFPDY